MDQCGLVYLGFKAVSQIPRARRSGGVLMLLSARERQGAVRSAQQPILAEEETLTANHSDGGAGLVGIRR
ncbi:hypothetical protein MHYP_G00118370 [Metynnis hypsauchen]